MSAVSSERIKKAAYLLRILYSARFYDQPRGFFRLELKQLRKALGVLRLRKETMKRLQEAALQRGLIIFPYGAHFVCIRTKDLSDCRLVPGDLFDEHYGNIFPGEEALDEADPSSVDRPHRLPEPGSELKMKVRLAA